jgi:hypothetical protein
MADSAALSFTTTPKERAPENPNAPAIERTIAIEVDGREYLVRKPKDALMARLGVATQRRTNPLLKVQLAIDFLADALLEPGRSALIARLEDENDDFDVDHALEILEAIAEQWKPEGRRGRR